jgi:uncharacterized protein (DUF983 family)
MIGISLNSLIRGWSRKCPRCGNDTLLKNYLSLKSNCNNCGLDFSKARADDGPAYLTILIVGHLMAPLLHFTFVKWRPEPIILFLIFAVGCVSLSLYLLPRIKCVIVGLQWERKMYGFKDSQ